MTESKIPETPSPPPDIPPTYESFMQRHEIPRKFLHGSIGFISIVLYFLGFQKPDVLYPLVAAVVPISIIEILRFNFPCMNKLFIFVCKNLMRPSERELHAINGVIWYLVGLVFVFSFAPKDVCFLSVLLLSWADLAASTFGRAYGKYTFKLTSSKSFAGSFAAFLVGVMCTQLMYRVLLPLAPEFNEPSVIAYNENLSELSLNKLSCIMGVVVSLAELCPLGDDNVSIPVICAVVQTFIIKATTLPPWHGIFV